MTGADRVEEAIAPEEAINNKAESGTLETSEDNKEHTFTDHSKTDELIGDSFHRTSLWGQRGGLAAA